MKYFPLLLLFLIGACSPEKKVLELTLDQKLRVVIDTAIKEKMNDPSSFEFVSMEIDTVSVRDTIERGMDRKYHTISSMDIDFARNDIIRTESWVRSGLKNRQELINDKIVLDSLIRTKAMDSLEYISAMSKITPAMENELVWYHVYFNYRGRNAFNALIKKQIVFDINKDFTIYRVFDR